MAVTVSSLNMRSESITQTGGMIEINLIALKNGATRRKQVVEVDVPAAATFGPCVRAGKLRELAVEALVAEVDSERLGVLEEELARVLESPFDDYDPKR